MLPWIVTALAGPSVVSVQPTWAEGATLSLEVREDAPGRAWVDGCASFELERREGDTWVAVPPRPCDRQLPAAPVDGALVLSAAAPAPGEYRARVVLGHGCVEGRPFVLAACATLEEVRSEPFRVTAKP